MSVQARVCTPLGVTWTRCWAALCRRHEGGRPYWLRILNTVSPRLLEGFGLKVGRKLRRQVCDAPRAGVVTAALDEAIDTRLRWCAVATPAKA
jgi:hypothetical protein